MNTNFNSNSNYGAYNTTSTNYTVADAEPSVRAEFIRKTYSHLAGAILLFSALEYILINSPLAEPILNTMLGGRFSWLIVLGAFMGISYLANWWANSQTSKTMQYLGLGLFVVAESILFLPLLYIAAERTGGSNIIGQAGIITLTLFAALTATVFVTRRDFSFLQPILMIGGFVALGVIVASILFGFNLGLLFSAVMVLFAAGAILYDTSNVMNRYNPNQHVAASLALFSSVALMFWYVLRILMGRR
ncbi:MAG: US12 family protein [Pyrinomonadaceae bacterium]|nr:US12 family protein [Pyrinomonadaceae bacterium]